MFLDLASLPELCSRRHPGWGDGAENVVFGGGATQVDWPVIGGTGEFLGATGVVHVPADTTWKHGDFVITLARQAWASWRPTTRIR